VWRALELREEAQLLHVRQAHPSQRELRHTGHAGVGGWRCLRLPALREQLLVLLLQPLQQLLARHVADLRGAEHRHLDAGARQAGVDRVQLSSGAAAPSVRRR